MQDHSVHFQPDGVYHIYNRAIGHEKLFLSDANYLFFMRQYGVYLNAVADTFCYCLMPNHFHLLVRMKPESALKTVFIEKLENRKKAPQEENLQGFENLGGLLGGLISKQFSNFFNS